MSKHKKGIIQGKTNQVWKVEEKKETKTDCKLNTQHKMVEINVNIWETSACGW